MNSKGAMGSWPVRAAVGFAIGVAIAAVDNFAFGGEVSPIVIFAMLLAATAIAGALWGGRGWMAAAAMWVCVPAAHIAKHVLGLPDTLHPNSYASILMLAAVTLVVASIGTGVGVSIRRLTVAPDKAPKP